MMLTLHTECTLDCAHKVTKDDGQCKDLHGHTWKVELEFIGDSQHVDKRGILVDFRIVKELKEHLDHKYLNKIIGTDATAENLCMYIHGFVRKQIHEKVVSKIKVYETAVNKLTWCESEWQ